MHVLVIDPLPRTGKATVAALDEQFVPARWFTQIAAARSLIARRQCAAIILTHDAPTYDAITTLRSLRAAGSTLPILVLLGRRSSSCASDVFEAGADDVLQRPFQVDELVARIRRLTTPKVAQQRTVLSYGPIALDLDAKRTYVAGEEIPLRRREVQLLHTMLQHPGQVLSRTQLLSHVWGSIDTPYANVVDVQVLRLRKALGAVGKDLIHTVRGFGYRLGE